MRAMILGALGAVLALSGCATKNYGRMQPVSSFEMSNYTCRDIALELSKVDAYEEQIKDRSGFDGRSALGVLGDFGIGNSMEKGAAVKSAIERRRQLQMLSAQQSCTSTATAPASAN